MEGKIKNAIAVILACAFFALVVEDVWYNIFRKKVSVENIREIQEAKKNGQEGDQ